MRLRSKQSADSSQRRRTIRKNYRVPEIFSFGPPVARIEKLVIRRTALRDCKYSTNKGDILVRMENTELTAPSSEAPQIAPVSRAERISSVDLLRGFSLLGILLMNIVSFGLPGPAYDNPAAAGGSTGWNLYIWATNYILFEGKMRAIFSMLFGAGIFIFTSRLEDRGAGIRTADLYFRRMLWLLAFGMVHAYFFWVGDILYSYALTGLLLFAVRKAPSKYLL